MPGQQQNNHEFTLTCDGSYRVLDAGDGFTTSNPCGVLTTKAAVGVSVSSPLFTTVITFIVNIILHYTHTLFPFAPLLPLFLPSASLLLPQRLCIVGYNTLSV